MLKDLSNLEYKNRGHFQNPEYLHGFRFGVLEGVEEGYNIGINEAMNWLLENDFILMDQAIQMLDALLPDSEKKYLSSIKE